MIECRKTETKAASNEKELLQEADEKFKWKQGNCAYLTRRKTRATRLQFNLFYFFMEGKFLKKLWCCVGGGM